MNGRVVIKLGGTSASDLSVVAFLAAELQRICDHGVIVHGGGKEVSALSERLGHRPVFENGVRMTSDAEMDLVEMVLAGLVNKRIARALCAAGVPAVGISGSDGGLILGTPIGGASGEPSRTGLPTTVDLAPLEALWSAGLLPLVAPPSAAQDGRSLNINADDVAFALATEMGAAALIFLSDVPGVLVDDGVVRLLTPNAVEEQIASGAINGGMLPKVRNAVTALAGGVHRVVIGRYERPGDLEQLLCGLAGTSITDAQTGAQGGDR